MLPNKLSILCGKIWSKRSAAAFAFPKERLLYAPAAVFANLLPREKTIMHWAEKLNAFHKPMMPVKSKWVSAAVRWAALCRGCGDLGVLATAKGWMLTIGGNGGAKPGVGQVIAQDLSEEALLELLDKVYQYFQDNKTGKERTIRTVERLGVEHLKAAVLK